MPEAFTPSSIFSSLSFPFLSFPPFLSSAVYQGTYLPEPAYLPYLLLSSGSPPVGSVSLLG